MDDKLTEIKYKYPEHHDPALDTAYTDKDMKKGAFMQPDVENIFYLRAVDYQISGSEDVRNVLFLVSHEKGKPETLSIKHRIRLSNGRKIEPKFPQPELEGKDLNKNILFLKGIISRCLVGLVQAKVMVLMDKDIEFTGSETEDEFIEKIMSSGLFSYGTSSKKSV